MPLTSAFAACTLLLLATILALVREVRLRRALQRLLGPTSFPLEEPACE